MIISELNTSDIQMELLPTEMLQGICDQLDSVSFTRLRACSRRLHGAQQSVDNQRTTTRIIQFRKTYHEIRYLWALMDASESKVSVPSRRFPGSNGHWFQKPMPLRADELSHLEAAVGRLPSEYRRFMRECGNPSAATLHVGTEVHPSSYVVCGCPGYGLFREPIYDSNQALASFNPTSADEQFTGLTSGTIEITTKGCTQATLLSLRGPSAGHVFNVNFDHFEVTLENTSFLDWMLSWADMVVNVLFETTFSSDED